MHRDIKPANLWLDATAGGRIKLLDFGLARQQQADVQLTSSGMILGTPAYMAPEQVAGKPEARSDLYSLGVVLYRLLAGRLPFPQTDTLALMVAVATETPPPLGSVGKNVPPALAALVMRLLAKKPEDRPASAKAVLEELKAIERDLAGTSGALAIPPSQGSKEEATAVAPAGGGTVTVEPAPRRKGGRLRRVLAGLCALVVLVAGGAAAALFFVPGLKDRVTAYVQGPPANEGGDPKDGPGATGGPKEEKKDKKEEKKDGKEDKKEEKKGEKKEPKKETKKEPKKEEPSLPPGIRRPPQGFIALFDGKSLDGWAQHSKAKGRKSPRFDKLGKFGKAGVWSAQDGTLRYAGKAHGYLETAKSYGDFELDLEWRLPSRGNSGVFLRLALEEGKVFPTSTAVGVEVQLMDDGAYPEMLAERRCGSIYGLIAPRKSGFRGPNQWHRYQIRCQGQHITVRFNGEVLVDAGPKQRPELARMPRRGPIGLQNQGGPVEFRNIFLKELPPRKKGKKAGKEDKAPGPG
jgi:hypothetical protein